MSDKIVHGISQKFNTMRKFRDDTPVGIKMDMFNLRVLMLKALAELVIDIDEERRQS